MESFYYNMETAITLEQIANPYTAATKVIMALEAQEFSADFGIIGNQIFCSQTKQIFNEEQFDVIAFYRFESEEEQGEGMIIYVIDRHGVTKGILLQTIHTSTLIPNNTLSQKLYTVCLYQ